MKKPHERNNTQLYIIRYTHTHRQQCQGYRIGTLFTEFVFRLGALLCFERNFFFSYGRNTHWRKIKTKTTTSHTHLAWTVCARALAYIFSCVLFENAINKTVRIESEGMGNGETAQTKKICTKCWFAYNMHII